LDKRYETIYIVDSNNEADSVVDRIDKKIKEFGGEIIKTSRWGKKRFAYEINKRQYGDYTAVEFDMESDKIKELEREFRLMEEVIRSMVYKVSKQHFKQRELDSKPR
jgi:small subunit ribosomal protein S6